MGYASIYGLANITIGEISKVTKMSRTGVISHFKDKEDMQLSIIKYIEQQYLESVVIKSQDENSLKRLRKYFLYWRTWIDELEEQYDGGSCPFVKGLIEYQDRKESAVQVYMDQQQKELIRYIGKLVNRCIDDGYFKSSINSEQFAFQAYSYYFGYNVFKNLYGKKEANEKSRQALAYLIQESLA
jgi:AcrR family transcriptional regulator